MSVITLDGLSKKQKALASVLWGMASRDELDSFLSSLSFKDKRDAELVLEMMIIGCHDQVIAVTEAADILDKVRSR